MHTRSLKSGEDRFVHALVRLPVAAGAAGPAAPAVALLAPAPRGPLGAPASPGLDGLLAQPAWTLAKRVQCWPDGRAELLVQVLAPAGDQRLVAAALQPLLDVGWQAPDDDACFDRWLQQAPPHHALVEPARYNAGPLWLACPFRAADFWPRLAVVGARAGQSVGYQTNLYACRPSLPVLRELALNDDWLQRRPGVPARLSALQARLSARARRSRWLVEDVLLLSAPALAVAVQHSVDALFRGVHDDIGAGPQLVFGEGTLADNLALACDHDPAWAADPRILAAQAADLEAAAACLDLQADLAAVPQPMVKPAMPPTAPTPGSGAAPYVFISYAHADADEMRRVRGWLQAAGIPVWSDELLQGGETWDAVLEDRVRHCALLLVLMSPAAARSRFVQRELRFADAMGRRLLCLRLREAELVEGMAMLLLPLQWIDAAHPQARPQLVDAIARWLRDDEAVRAG